MRYAEIESELGFDPSERDAWPKEMRYAYVVLPPNNSALNFAAGVAYERRRRRREAAEAVAALSRREPRPTIGA